MHKVTVCGLNTQSLPKLTTSQSDALMIKLKQGDKMAREEFINANIRLVLSVVQRFYNKGNSDDLFQVGMIGLLKAVDGFDMAYNVRFSTYAVPMIMGEIRRWVKDSSGIKVSRNLRDIAYKALKCKEVMELRQQASPSLMEIAAEIDIPLRQVEEALDAVSDTMSLQEQVFSDGEDSLLLLEQISDTKQNEELWTENISIRDGMIALPDKEKEVIMLRYFVGKTQVEISNKIGISQAQVSRLEKNAISRLKQYF